MINKDKANKCPRCNDTGVIIKQESQNEPITRTICLCMVEEAEPKRIPHDIYGNRIQYEDLRPEFKSICLCPCHKDNIPLMHFYPCCGLEYERYINEDNTIDLERYFIFKSENNKGYIRYIR